ncbi:MAG: HD domain-containing protein [Desulfovibrio sp.]|uniref:HD domain-containing protein n=1 Tax=Desulfovibrio sp. TaxID=885 RepID=UPI0025C439A6|nr:HD domain-containing protein [Desulfovibrio sp.]MCI7569422.1 HD domain-containing protein [Desulfovibrio sp.]
MVTSNRRKRKTATPAADGAQAGLTTPATPETAPEQPAAPEAAIIVPAAAQTDSARAEQRAKTPARPATDTDAAPASPQPSDSPEQDASLEHGRHVAFLADRLFDELAPLHGLGKRWRQRLHLAALLHDIGFAEGRKKHHKTSMHKIDTDKSLDIADKDRPLVALLARYHRKAWPSLKHKRFADLSGRKRDAVSKAAAILRIADGLDYRHLGNIQDLSVEVTDTDLRLLLRACGECAPERARAEKKGDLLEHIFARTLKCVCREA